MRHQGSTLQEGLSKTSAMEDPFTLFEQWYEQNLKTNSFEPTKVTLATLGQDGLPSARVVLLKQYDQKGFCFFTNYESLKGQELIAEPKAALVFHWDKPEHQQIRIRGRVEKTTYQESNAYFQKRARGSQIGAWASPQSRPIADRQELEALVQEVEAKFEGKEVPCPENWGGFRLVPFSMEFWQAGEHRLHDRYKYARKDENSDWTMQRLAP